MRKLLVVLVALAAVAIFAANQSVIHQPGVAGGFNVSLSGDATIRVHQWLDATFTPGVADIFDYGNLSELKLGSLSIDSNAQVKIAISANWDGLAGWITVGGYSPVGVFGDGTYDVKALNLVINKDTPAIQSGYTVAVTINITPTVTF